MLNLSFSYKKSATISENLNLSTTIPTLLPAYVLTTSLTMTPSDGSGKKPFENIVGKGEIACRSNFSFSHNVFYSINDRKYNYFCYI